MCSAILEVDQLLLLYFSQFFDEFHHFHNLSTSGTAMPSMLAVNTETHFQSCFFPDPTITFDCPNSSGQNHRGQKSNQCRVVLARKKMEV